MSFPSERVHVSAHTESTAGATAAQVLPSLAAQQHVAAVPALPLMPLAPSALLVTDEREVSSDRAATGQETDPFHSDYAQVQLRPNDNATRASMSLRDLFWSYLRLNTLSSLRKQGMLGLVKEKQNERKNVATALVMLRVSQAAEEATMSIDTWLCPNIIDWTPSSLEIFFSDHKRVRSFFELRSSCSRLSAQRRASGYQRTAGSTYTPSNSFHAS
jgi:hypothetical protein